MTISIPPPGSRRRGRVRVPSARALGLVLAVAAAGPPALGADGGAGDASIRPFRVHVPDAALADLRRRIAATRWPDRQTVGDHSQGAQVAELQELVRYWGTGYDWRKAEASLDALPQFTTSIDGLDIHFIHVRSRQQGALPVIITHGWPGSVLEFLKVIGPLTDPVAHGGSPDDAFDPSSPRTSTVPRSRGPAGPTAT
jgi:microsomal epoxide hydrolase